MPVEKTVEELFEEYVILENSLKDTSKIQEMIVFGYYEKRKQQIVQEVKSQVRREVVEEILNKIINRGRLKNSAEILTIINDEIRALSKGITLKN